MTYRLAVIGGGNMGAALVGGLLGAGWAAADLAIVEVLPARVEELRTMFPGVALSNDIPACEAALVAVKPYDVPAACTAAVAAGAKRLLSIAAGVSIATLQQAAEQLLDEQLAGGHVDESTGKPLPTPPGGAIVAIDVRTGEVLAAASAPRFDLALFSDGKRFISGVMWRQPSHPALRPNNSVDIVCRPEINTFNGTVELQANLQAVQLAGR